MKLTIFNHESKLIQVDIKIYLYSQFNEVILLRTGKGFGNLFLKAVSYFNYAILNNVMFCIDFDKYNNFEYNNYFDKNYDIEYKDFIKKNPSCKVISTNDLPSNNITDGLGIFYNYWISINLILKIV